MAPFIIVPIMGIRTKGSPSGRNHEDRKIEMY